MKKHFFSAFAILLSLLLLLTSCKGVNLNDNTKTDDPNQNQNLIPQVGFDSWATGDHATNFTVLESDLSAFDLEFSKRDLAHEVVPINPTTIQFSGDKVTISSAKAKRGDDGAIHIYSEGTYVLSGSSQNARIVVDASQADKITILLNGVSIHSPNGPAIYVKAADKVTINIVKDTENTLSDGTSYTFTDGDSTPSAVIYSKDDLAINGYGKLTLQGNKKHGIVSKDDLVITGGIIDVTSMGVAIEGKDNVKIGGGTFTLLAGTDGIRSDNVTDAHRGYVYVKDATISAVCGNDGIQASNAVIIDGGSIEITTMGSEDPTASAKGIKSDSDVVIRGGNLTVTAYEDAINAKKSVVVSGGTMTLDAIDDAINADLDVIVRDGQINVANSGVAIKAQDVLIAGGALSLLSENDGIKASDKTDVTSGNIAVTGGYLYVSAKKDCLDASASIIITGGVTLIDGESIDKNATMNAAASIAISGGVLIATGSSDTVKNVTTASNQGVMKVNFSEQSANTPLVVCDANGKVIVSVSPTKKFSAALISAPALQKDNTYTLYTGGTVTDANTNGYAENVAYAKGTSLLTVTFTTNVYKQPK